MSNAEAEIRALRDALDEAMDRRRIETCNDCPCVQLGGWSDGDYCRLADRAMRECGKPPAWCPLRSKPVLLEVTP